MIIIDSKDYYTTNRRGHIFINLPLHFSRGKFVSPKYSSNITRLYDYDVVMKMMIMMIIVMVTMIIVMVMMIDDDDDDDDDDNTV